jgi:hypothetical protein
VGSRFEGKAYVINGGFPPFYLNAHVNVFLSLQTFKNGKIKKVKLIAGTILIYEAICFRFISEIWTLIS